jgi:N-acetylglutamate synthase
LSGISHTPPPLAQDVGKKVSIRLHEDGGFRDLLGILHSPNQVLKKDGTLANFDAALIAAWRIVETPQYPAGKGQPLSLRILELERIAEKSWPANTTEIRGGWRYRISNGFTFRGNSILPVGAPPYGEPQLPIADELEFAIQRYAEAGVTPAIHIPMPLYEKLDEVLEGAGWEMRIEAHLMIADSPAIPRTALPDGATLEVLDEPSEEWLAVQGKAVGYEVMLNYPAQYFGVRVDGALVSVMRVSGADGWAILSRLFVAENLRGRGLSKAIISAALDRLKDSSITKIALQVDITNATAIGLYSSLRFRVHHNYRFRVKS